MSHTFHFGVYMAKVSWSLPTAQ